LQHSTINHTNAQICNVVANEYAPPDLERHVLLKPSMAQWLQEVWWQHFVLTIGIVMDYVHIGLPIILISQIFYHISLQGKSSTILHHGRLAIL